MLLSRLFFHLTPLLSGVLAAPMPASAPLDASVLTDLQAREITPLPDPATDNPLFKRYDPQCREQGQRLVPVDHVQKCRDYLAGLGTKDCYVVGNQIKMCEIGNCLVYGSRASTAPYLVSSYCRDVATAVTWIVDNCKQCGSKYCHTQGSQAANGNGNLIIHVVWRDT